MGGGVSGGGVSKTAGAVAYEEHPKIVEIIKHVPVIQKVEVIKPVEVIRTVNVPGKIANILQFAFNIFFP